MKKFAFAGLALLVAGTALAQNPFPQGQFPGGQGRPDQGRPDQGRGDRDQQGFGRGRGGFERCGYERNNRNDFWKDLKDQIQDVIEDAQAIQAVANERFGGAEASTFNDGRVVDAYLAVGSLLGQAQATLKMTEVDWNNWDRFAQATDRANVGQAVDNLQKAANALKPPADVFGVYGRGRYGLGQRLDCDIADLRKITDALNDQWRQGRPGQGGGRGGRGGQRDSRGSATVQVTVGLLLEVVIAPGRVLQGNSDGTPLSRIVSQSTTDRRGESLRNVRNVTVISRSPVSRISTSWGFNRNGDIVVTFRSANGLPQADTFDIFWD